MRAAGRAWAENLWANLAGHELDGLYAGSLAAFVSRKLQGDQRHHNVAGGFGQGDNLYK